MRHQAWLIASLATFVLTAGAHAGGSAPGTTCAPASWTVDGGAVAVGPLQVGTLYLRNEGPWLNARCQLKRWRSGTRNGGTRLRALFSCDTSDGTGLPQSMAL